MREHGMNDATCGESRLMGRVQDGRIVVEGAIPWPDGAAVTIHASNGPLPAISMTGHVIVAGFGLAGRCVVELLRAAQIRTTVVDINSATAATQRALGQDIVEGNITDSATLIQARVTEASALALTIPDEEAVLRATSLARELNPKIFIIARTNYSSKGLEAAQLGADEVIKAEQAVARQFRERIQARFNLS